MAKIPGNMAEVSTERFILPEDVYPARITESKVGKSSTNKDMATLIVEVTNTTGTGPKTLNLSENFVFEKNDGTPNDGALRAYKRVVELLLGEERANDPDYDSDELVGIDLQVFVKGDSYEDKITKEPVPINRIARYLAA